MVLTVHRWFANKSCPGDWLYSRLGNVTKALNTSTTTKPNTQTSSKKKSVDTIAREVIQGKWGNGSARKSKLTKAGYDYNAVQKRVNRLLA